MKFFSFKKMAVTLTAVLVFSSMMTSNTGYMSKVFAEDIEQSIEISHMTTGADMGTTDINSFSEIDTSAAEIEMDSNDLNTLTDISSTVAEIGTNNVEISALSAFIPPVGSTSQYAYQENANRYTESNAIFQTVYDKTSISFFINYYQSGVLIGRNPNPLGKYMSYISYSLNGSELDSCDRVYYADSNGYLQANSVLQGSSIVGKFTWLLSISHY